MEESTIDSHVELILCEVLRIAKRESYDIIIDLIVRKRHFDENEGMRTIINILMNAITMEKIEAAKDYVDNHYLWPHWVGAMIETLVDISVLALNDHGLEINIMSIESILEDDHDPTKCIIA